METSTVSYQSFRSSYSLIQIKTQYPINLLFNNFKLEIGHYLFDTISLCVSNYDYVKRTSL